MAEVNIFHYFPTKSLIHDFNARFKIVFLFFFSLASINASMLGLSVLTLLLLLASYLSNLPFSAFVKEIKYFLFFVPILIIIPAFNMEGEEIKVFLISGLSQEGLLYGINYAWKLFLFVILGVLIIGTTSLAALTNAIEWLLSPIPFISAAKTALMIKLTISFVPLILDQTFEILLAQKSRGIENRKNPIKKIRFTLYPLSLKTLTRVEEVALAMESRGYTGNRTKRKVILKRSDWQIIFISMLVCLFVFVFLDK